MKNTDEYKGRLNLVKRLNSSINGNPRFIVSIMDDHGNGVTCRTRPDDMLSYSIQNDDGFQVRARVAFLYGKLNLIDYEIIGDKLS